MEENRVSLWRSDDDQRREPYQQTTIADAIAWVMIRQGFFGGHLLDRFTTIRSGKSALL